MFKKTRENQNGFTLIELVIAISVFSLAILGAMALAIANQRLATQNYDRVLAANLAREGIELSRYIRDSNWLRIEANEDCDTSSPTTIELCDWNLDLLYRYMTIDKDGRDTIVDLSGRCPSLSTDIAGCMDICKTSGECDLVKDNDGFYRATGLGNETNMRRLLNVALICPDTSPNNGDSIEENVATGTCTPSTSDPIGIRVISRVEWERYGKEDFIEAVEYLYNWKQ